jgi:protein transport protein SEC31
VKVHHTYVALEVSDFGSAHKIHHDLMTTQFEKVGLWIVGVKKLVDGLERASQPMVSPVNSHMPFSPAQNPLHNQGFGAPSPSQMFNPSNPPIQTYQSSMPPPPIQGFNQQNVIAPPPTQNFNQQNVAPPPTQGFNNPTTSPPPMQSYKQNQPLPAPPVQGFNQPVSQGYGQPTLQRKTSMAPPSSQGFGNQNRVFEGQNASSMPANGFSQPSPPSHSEQQPLPPPPQTTGFNQAPSQQRVPNSAAPQQLQHPPNSGMQPHPQVQRKPSNVGFSAGRPPPPQNSSARMTAPPSNQGFAKHPSSQGPPQGLNRPPPTGYSQAPPPPGYGPPPGQRPPQQFARPPPPTGPFGQQ